jgi:hypothetical protein
MNALRRLAAILFVAFYAFIVTSGNILASTILLTSAFPDEQTRIRLACRTAGKQV